MADKVLENRVNVRFPLNKALPQLKEGSVEYSDQVIVERLTDEELRSIWFATKDFPMYEIKDSEAFFDLSRINPGFENVDDFCRQIRETGNYQVSKKDAQRVRKSKSTISVPLSKLELIKDDNEWAHININTSKDRTQFNKYQQPLVERAFGSMETSSIGRDKSDFIEYMNLLKAKGISTTRFYALNPEYVMEHAKKGPIARVSRLYDFNSSSSFNAVVRYVVDYNFRVRGVPVGAEGATREKMGIQIPKNVLSALEKGNGFEYNGMIYIPTSADNIKLK